MSVTGLISRMLGPAEVARFHLEVIPADSSGLDVFEIGHNGKQVVLRGNTGVTLANGLNNYLKYTLNASISWGRERSGILVNLPGELPVPQSQRVVLPMKWRYAWNVCTPGYSFVWYSEDQWQYMIDWMALQGVNLPLAFNGQEAVFADVFRSLGLTDHEIWAYFSGPAFLPWNRMGNMQAFGAYNGPGVRGLDEGWLDSQRDLQLKIVAAMRLYGMTPVLPGFAGHVPAGMKRVFPNASFTHTADWAGFNATYGSVTLMEPTDPEFLTVGTAINKAILRAFGDPSGAEQPMFNADMYNEMQPARGDSSYLTDCNKAMYQAMLAADSRAVYVMQAWLFFSDPTFWTYDRVKAFLAAVPLGSMLILDLYTDVAPVWNKYDSFFGHNWIWNSLIVFGGRRGIYGSLPNYVTSPYETRAKASNMIGIGVTPEAIDMSQPMFDVTLEAGWRPSPPDGTAWLQSYAVRRYGGYSVSMSQAYHLLERGAYDNRGIDTSIIEDVPTVSPSGSRNTNATSFVEALELFVKSFAEEGLDVSSGPASYDLTDINRQVLCNVFQDLHAVYAARYTVLQGMGAKAVPELRSIAEKMLELIAYLDTVNAADINFLLGPWIEDAKRWGFNASQVENRVYNARNQITLWGPRGEINDYAAKIGWSGLVKDYYFRRWSSHTQYTLEALSSGDIPDFGKWSAQNLKWEQAWTFNTSAQYSTLPSGASPLDLARSTLATYAAPLNTTEYVARPGYGLPADPPAQWVEIAGSTNMAAVGSDCPWLAHGDLGSVSACEKSCDRNAACNAVNWNSHIPACELRQCVDPKHPALTPMAGWNVYGNVAGRLPVISKAWHTNPGVLAYLCDSTPACKGFTSQGFITGNVTALRPASGITTYIKSN